MCVLVVVPGQAVLVNPTFDPVLATNDAPPPRNPVIDPKWDGVRSIITLRRDGTVSIRSRNG